MRWLAIDWSGDARPSAQRRKIWLAEAGPAGVVRLEDGRTREELIQHLLELARQDRELAVGFDFSFSLPAWFLAANGCQSAPELWLLAARHGAQWLGECRPPWWGRKGTRRVDLGRERPLFRATEGARPGPGGPGGGGPKSSFQIAGPGAVGTGALRGMPHLLALRAAGFAIWPFDDWQPPVALEIYPRWLTGAVNKSSRAARMLALQRVDPRMASDWVERASQGEDAFDAAVSALVMARHLHDPLACVRAADAVGTGGGGTDRLEGRIWAPPPGSSWPGGP